MQNHEILETIHRLVSEGHEVKFAPCDKEHPEQGFKYVIDGPRGTREADSKDGFSGMFQMSGGSRLANVFRMAQAFLAFARK